jgi:CRISPR-associated exonuclease Cas4
MLGTAVPAGALFYGQTRRRLDITFDSGLRQETEDAAARLHQIFASRITPKPVRAPKCDQCSLLEICMPDAPAHSAQRYLEQALRREP